MSAPTKNKLKNQPAALFMQKPADLVVDILSLEELGQMIANAKKIPKGEYDLVIEYKMGTAPLSVAKNMAMPGVGVALGGLGLRVSKKPGALTIKVD